MLLRRLALMLALTFAAPACGGDGYEATYVAPEQGCPKVDDYLGGLYALLDDGRLGHVRQLLEATLTDDERADLVVAAVRIVSAFEPGTFVALGGLADAVSGSQGLQSTMARLLRWYVEEGPGAPHTEATGLARVLIATCDLPPLLRLVDALLADEALHRSVRELLAGVDLGAALGDVSVDGATGRPAVVALARNILVAFTRPDFEVQRILDLLALVVDLDAPPWPALTETLTRLLGPGPTRDSLVGLAHCLLAVDPDLVLVGTVFDMATDPDLDLLGGLATVDLGDPSASLLPPTVAAPLHAALRFLAEDAPALASVRTILTAAMRDDIAPGVLGDLADVLDAAILGDVVALLGAVATRTCPQ